MEFTRKNRRGKDLKVKVTTTHPYTNARRSDMVYCVVYFVFEYTRRKGLFRRKQVIRDDSPLHYEKLNIEKVRGWKEKEYEKWVDDTMEKYQDKLDGWKADEETQKFLEEHGAK